MAYTHPYHTLMNFPYIHMHLPAMFSPIHGLVPSYTPFQHENGLTSKLDLLVFPTLQNVQRFIAYLYFNRLQIPPMGSKQFWPSRHIPLFSEVGSCAYPRIPPGRDRPFLPDRCALPSDIQINHFTFCCGDIKPSYKWKSEWGMHAAHTAGSRRLRLEYRRVLSQVKYYMMTCGDSGPGISTRYGYVITDHEVVLLRRHSGPENLHDIDVSPSYPLQEVPQPGGMSAMLALILIHLLAGDTSVGAGLCAV